jgi:enolase
MAIGTAIVSVTARQVYSDRGHPGVEATVVTDNGARGVAICTAGISVGTHEVQFAYDVGPKWRGKGVQRAVDSVNDVISFELIGMDASKQLEIDDVLLNVGGPGAKQRLGGNATAAVSAAALKAGAASLGIALYQHIGGVNAVTLPVCGALCMIGSDRYGAGAKSGGKPSHAFMAYDFATFSEASYAAWDVLQEWGETMKTKFGLPKATINRYPAFPAGIVQHDREIWDAMTETIVKCGYEDKVGIQIDIAADTYYDDETDKFVGLFSAEPKSRDDLFEFYRWMVDEYPFVILEDLLSEDDFEGFALMTQELGVQVVGDDLFVTTPSRVQHGIDLGAANTVLLKVNQIGTISEAFDMVRLAHRNGYGVMPCSSRGEGEDIADYCVGLNVGTVRETGVGRSGNRMLEIEAELGSRAQFAGVQGLKGERFQK